MAAGVHGEADGLYLVAAELAPDELAPSAAAVRRALSGVTECHYNMQTFDSRGVRDAQDDRE